MKLKVVLESRDRGGFKAYIPSLPGCISRGITEGEALENIRRAALLHFGIQEVIHPKYRIDV